MLLVKCYQLDPSSVGAQINDTGSNQIGFWAMNLKIVLVYVLLRPS